MQRQKEAETHVGLCNRARYSTSLPLFKKRDLKTAVTFDSILNLRPLLIAPPSPNALMRLQTEDLHTHTHTHKNPV